MKAVPVLLVLLVCSSCSLFKGEEEPILDIKNGRISGIGIGTSYERAKEVWDEGCVPESNNDFAAITCHSGPHAGWGAVFGTERDLLEKPDGSTTRTAYDILIGLDRFPGESKEGLRFGSTRDEVQAALGAPMPGRSTELYDMGRFFVEPLYDYETGTSLKWIRFTRFISTY